MGEKKLGDIYFKKQNYQKSGEWYSKVLNSKNKNAIKLSLEGIQKIGDHFREEKNHQEAFKWYQKLLKSCPPDICVHLGNYYNDPKKYNLNHPPNLYLALKLYTKATIRLSLIHI